MTAEIASHVMPSIVPDVRPIVHKGQTLFIQDSQFKDRGCEMGQRGPVPNRSDDLARPRERKGGEHTNAAVTKGMSRPASIPEPDQTWHPIAILLWDSTLESGQADFYESSDYAFLYSVCDDLSYYKRGVKRSGQMLVAIYGAFERLLITEGDRRRVRVELEDAETGEDEATAQVMDEYEQGLRLVS